MLEIQNLMMSVTKSLFLGREDAGAKFLVLR